MANNIVPVRNALLSVYYKAGIVEMAQVLHISGVKLYSSGGTAKAINGAGLPVTDVADYTGFPPHVRPSCRNAASEDPRRHPLSRDVQQDREDLVRQGMVPFDLVVVNLYPVQEAINKPGATIEDVVKLIDIGGPTLLRGAAKNHKHVAAVVDPRDYVTIGTMVRDLGGADDMTRLQLAKTVFRRMSDYDNAINAFLTDYQQRMMHEAR